MQQVGVARQFLARFPRHVLRLVISQWQVAIAAGGFHIIGGDFIKREEAHGRTVFRRHIGDGRAVRQ